MMHDFIFNISLFLYFLATAGFLANIITLRKDAGKVANLFLYGAFVAHGLAILLRMFEAGHTPLVSMHESLSFVAWCMVGGYLILQSLNRVKSLGAFVTPLALVIMIASSIQKRQIPSLPPALQSAWLPIHAAICLAAYAIFALAFCLAIMYLIQERQIKDRRLGAIFRRLPSLENLDIMIGRCLAVGFLLLTIGIITGSIWAENAWGSYWSWDPKETWSLITWLFYAALLHQRLTVGWRGRKAAIMTILAFAILVFTFLGVNLLIPSEHSYAASFK
ncbi:c-type cytochrome biogenesis protein CcsB [Dissulfurimicrobium hydrothermale]|uniref:c-type cytochrome biogenesis protein CcsB n=1 Tax=Dissulfurimicrobium hydrothermale TaxID=1750598 RepID=UPI001EDB54D2|nr:c-type cytochrome biogenesis protein CcsB [Dissulfurimicrobium hydrothermale]UKL14188.1 c-type cytochrome biogenesis protein CcsB [Dissulfurimicrobium hydrothermale]